MRKRRYALGVASGGGRGIPPTACAQDGHTRGAPAPRGRPPHHPPRPCMGRDGLTKASDSPPAGTREPAPWQREAAADGRGDPCAVTRPSHRKAGKRQCGDRCPAPVPSPSRVPSETLPAQTPYEPREGRQEARLAPMRASTRLTRRPAGRTALRASYPSHESAELPPPAPDEGLAQSVAYRTKNQPREL